MITQRSTEPTNSRILVIGGTGKTGRCVAERLTVRGLPVRVGSRSGHPPFHWEDPGTWETVLDGIAAVYVPYHPDVDRFEGVWSAANMARTVLTTAAVACLAQALRLQCAATSPQAAPHLTACSLPRRHLGDGLQAPRARSGPLP
ncbi:hypothetical protein [Streptomyces sp. NRRL B-3648]|uniref:hypothetical protein n=1 Tax=Streptomyces sp. NRRL B-3648 TaxID=1519493 RepID=UPI00131D7A90|nr:hypothetical protein [Streptomyces sp. NRRL B-3648]